MTTRPDGWGYEPQEMKGKRVLITGGSSGIGRATALMLAKLGAHVHIVAHNPKRLEDAEREIRKAATGKVFATLADLSKREEIGKIFADVDRNWGGLDVLLNNAAVGGENVITMDEDEIHEAMQVNLMAPLYCAKYALERMETGAQIINVGSMSAVVREARSGVYVAGKAGMQGWSESMRKQLSERGIRVSLLELGSVDTNLHEAKTQEAIERQKEEVREETMMIPEEVAEAIYFCMIQPRRCAVVVLQLRPLRQAI